MKLLSPAQRCWMLGLPAWLWKWVWSQLGSPPCPLLCRSTARAFLPQCSIVGTLLPVTCGFQIYLPVSNLYFLKQFFVLFCFLAEEKMPSALDTHHSMSNLACRDWLVGVSSCQWSHGLWISKPEPRDRRSCRNWLSQSLCNMREGESGGMKYLQDKPNMHSCTYFNTQASHTTPRKCSGHLFL